MSYTLVCIIIGESTAFPVKIDETQTVGELKKFIKKETEPDLDGVAAHRLTLYKVNIDMSDKAKFTKEVQDISQDLSKTEKELFNPSEELSHVFKSPDPLKGNIHILIQLPGESIDPKVGGAVAEVNVVHTLYHPKKCHPNVSQ